MEQPFNFQFMNSKSGNSPIPQQQDSCDITTWWLHQHLQTLNIPGVTVMVMFIIM